MSLEIMPPLSAAVLAGGQSQRMGTDKALLLMDGRPLIERALCALEQVSDDVFVVGDRPAYHRFGASVFADAFPGTGPLGGIATALQRAKHDDVLIVACDMPLLNVRLLRALAAEPRGYQVLIPEVDNDTCSDRARARLETLHAIYSRSCLDAILRRLDAGQYHVKGLLDDVSVRSVGEEWIRTRDPQLRSFTNTNSEVEFQEAALLSHSRELDEGKIQGESNECETMRSF